MVDTLENTLNSARELGDSYRKLSVLLVAQYATLGEIHERSDAAAKDYLDATRNTYNDVAQERTTQFQDLYREWKTHYESHLADYSKTAHASNSTWQQWHEQATELFGSEHPLATKQAEQMQKSYEDFYAAYRQPQADQAGWTYQYGYPFNTAETLNPEAKQAA